MDVMIGDDRIRVVLDTNIFVAAYWAPGSASARVLAACAEGLVRLQYSREVREEVEAVLRTISASREYTNRIAALWDRAELVTAVSLDNLQIRDPSDRKFLEAAVGGDADFLVTNDDHLLSVGFAGRTEVIKPQSALRLLGIEAPRRGRADV